VLAALLVLLCLLVIAGLGYFVIYPQVDAAYHWRHAQRAIDAYEFQQATADLGQCLEVWKDSGETHFLMARTCRRAGELEGARAQLQEAKRLHWVQDQIRLEYLLIQAQTLMTPRLQLALRGYLAGGRTDETLVLEALANGCLQGNLLKDAYHWTSLWTSRHPDDWHARLWQGRVFSAARRHKRAAQEYQQLLDKVPDYLPGHLGLAESLLKTKRFEEALPHFERVLRVEPPDPHALLGLAHCQRAIGQPEVAQATVERLCDGHPDYVPALALRGQLELESDNPDKALLWFRRAYSLDANDWETNYGLAEALRMLGKEKEARRYARRSQALDEDQRLLGRLIDEVLTNPDDVSLRREISTTFLRLGNEQEGLRWLISALLADPGNQSTRKALEDAIHGLGDPKLEQGYREVLRKLDKAPTKDES
jgi:tetratricopeptide (TPR) repeat protein